MAEIQVDGSPARLGSHVIAIVASTEALPGVAALLHAAPSGGDLVALAAPPAPLVDADAEGWLDELRAASPLPVRPVEGSAPAAPGAVLSSPRGLRLEERDGALWVVEAEEAAGASTDALLCSLADVAGERSVGILLSETGSDGRRGVSVLQDRGGVVVGTSGSLPELDRRLAPDELGRWLASHLERSASGLELSLHDALGDVCEAVRVLTGHDFSHYRESTLRRRLSRRLQVLQLESAADYLKHLQETPAEARALLSDLLIGVTSFFRDPAAYDALAEKVLRPLLEGSRAGQPLRVWVAGCSTGEEAYSLAMLLREQMDALAIERDVQIFATDIHRRALELARQGVFPRSAAARLGPERKQRFFLARGDRLYVKKHLREMCLFALHDLLRDAPFPRLDLVSCRNVLIYLRPAPQKKLLSVFHYALRPDGYLFLGPSETMGDQRELFRNVDSSHRILQRRPGPATSDVWRGLGGAPARSLDAPVDNPDLRQVAERVLLDDIAPRYAVVNEEGEMVTASSGIGRYLEVPEGPFDRHIGRLARPPLRIAVRAALQRAVETRAASAHGDVALESGGELQRVRVFVRPITELSAVEPLFLVAFQDQGPLARAAEASGKGAEAEALVDHLERELANARAELEHTMQDLEASNEELKSSNEELRSINEELHSANEELRTSKEEVETSNEALARANADLENLLESHPVATLFLDDSLRIRSFTPAATSIYPLQGADLGRSLGDLAHRAVRMPPLPDPKTLRASETSAQDELELDDGRRLLRRVSPYRTAAGKPDGLVVSFIDVTELRSREAALARREAELRLVIHSVPGLISYVDTDERYQFANEAYERVFGRPVDDIVGARVADLYSEGAYRVARPHLEKALAGARADYDVVVDTPMGPRVLESAYVPDEDGAGGVRGVFVLSRDVTEQRRMEEAIRHSEARHREVLERISDAFVSLDENWRYTYVNEAASRMLGKTREEMLGRHMREVFPDAADGDFERSAREALKTQLPAFFEAYSRAFDRWYECRCYPGEGGVSVFFSDVTDRRAAEEDAKRHLAHIEALNAALQDRTAEIEALISHAPIGLAFFDREHRFVRINQQLAETRGISIEDHLGRTLREIAPGSADKVGVVLERVFATGEVVPEVEVTGEPNGPSGAQRHYLCGLFPVRGRDEITAVGTFVVDITERKQAEQELAAARTGAEAASHAKSEFLANMSHELRTPMTAILGFTDILLSRQHDEKSRQQLKTIKRNGEHLTQILNDILDLSRIEAGRLAVVRERFSLVELLEDVRALMQVRAHEKGLPLLIEYEGTVPLRVEGDRTRLRQILVNLVNNAIKFTDEGHVRLVVALLQDDDAPRLELRVEDSGIGISPDLVHRLFEPFVQGDASGQRRHGGTGLGLGICRRLTEMLGGDIRVESKPGVGSVFSVRVPAGDLRDTPMVDPSTEEIEPEPTDASVYLSRSPLVCRVLVADDQSEIREVLAEYLRSAGAEVELAADGLEALCLVDRAGEEGRPFDALLLDMQMPVLDGYEVARRLRGRGDKRPILAVTAAAMKEDQERALAAGCDEHLSKPVDPARLLDALAQHLSARPSEGGPTPALAPTTGANILVVEDSDDVRDILGETLSDLGHDVRLAGNAEQALELCTSFLPDVAFVDLTLPDLDGIELVRRLRQSPRLRAVRFVALSGHEDPERKQRAVEVGFVRYLVKPVRVADLERVIDEERARVSEPLES